AKPPDILLRRAGNRNETRQRSRSLIGRQVRRLAHIDHCARKPENVRRRNAELTSSLSNRRNLLMRRGKLTRHPTQTSLKCRHLRRSAIHSLLHTSPRG